MLISFYGTHVGLSPEQMATIKKVLITLKPTQTYCDNTNSGYQFSALVNDLKIPFKILTKLNIPKIVNKSDKNIVAVATKRVTRADPSWYILNKIPKDKKPIILYPDGSILGINIKGVTQFRNNK